MFAGTALSRDTFKVTMRVDISWKGPRTAEIVLGTGSQRAADGSLSWLSEVFGFETGKSYLVWLHGKGPEFVASACSRTASLPFAEKEFAKLDQLAKRQVIEPVR